MKHHDIIRHETRKLIKSLRINCTEESFIGSILRVADDDDDLPTTRIQ